MVSDKEIRKIKRHRRKLDRFTWEIRSLAYKSPDKRIKDKLQETAIACEEIISNLNTINTLKEQRQ